MKRWTAHALFGAVALCVTGMAAREAFELQRAHAINQAVAQATASPAGVPHKDANNDKLPEVRFARARVLSMAGQHDAVVKQYSGLIQDGSPVGLRQAALYNLANLYLRQAMASAPGDALATMELAKQRYRDLLRVDPQDWDARYNLERALWMAPENEASFAAEPQQPAEQRRVRMRGMEAGDLP